MFYRKRSYSLRQRRRKTKRTFLILISVIVLFAGFITLGNVLKRRADDSKSSSTPIPPEITRRPEDAAADIAAPAIRSFTMSLPDLAGKTDADMREAAREIIAANTSETAENTETGEISEENPLTYTGVTVALTDSSGSPLFSSTTSDSIGEDTSDRCSLFDFVSAMHSEGLRTVGTVNISKFATDTASEEMLRSYEMALICEAWEYGIDEILLCGFDLGDNLGAEIEYLKKLKSLSPGILFGVSLPYGNLKVGDSALESLAASADYLSIELGKPENGMTNYDYLSKILTDSVSLFVRYSPRLVMRVTDGYKAEEIYSVLAENSVDSWIIRSEAE